MKRLDGIRPTRQKTKAIKRGISKYPDLTPWVKSNATGEVNKTVATKQKVHKSKKAVTNKVTHKKMPSRFIFWRRSFSGFSLVTILLAAMVGIFSVFQGGFAFTDGLLGKATSGSQALLEGSSLLADQEYDKAASQFVDAGEAFKKIHQDLASFSGMAEVASQVVPGDPLQSARQLSQAGTHFSNAGVALVETLEVFNNLNVDQVDFALGEVNVNERTDLQANEESFVKALVLAQDSFDQVIDETAKAVALVEDVDLDRLPESVRGKLKPLLGQLPVITQELNQIDGLLGVLAQIMAVDRAKYYAVVLQNTRELRPTGGFIGQFALVKIQNGLVEDIKVKSIYDADGQVTKKVKAPAGLNIISDSWSLRDANWSADFSKSAQDILSFFEETGDPPLDGVIAMTPRIVEDLINHLGPVTLEELGLEITAENFVEEAQYEVPNKDTARDAVFFPAFAQKLLNKMFQPESTNWPFYAELLLGAIQRKDLQLYFTDPTQQRLVSILGADGELKPNGQDLLAISESNIGGGKTDHFIQEERNLNVEVGQSSVKHDLVINRKDTRIDEFKHLENRQYLRFYVPKGSRLISASGFDKDFKELLEYDCNDCYQNNQDSSSTPVTYDQDSNTEIYSDGEFTVFANWVSLLPGDEREIKISYETPLDLVATNNSLKLGLWRQAGTADIVQNVTVSTTGERQLLYASGLMQDSQNMASGSVTLDQNRIIGILFE